MNINKINYSQQNQTQQLSFKKLKGIQYVGNFNPEISMEHAKAVKAFKENEAFKKFFQKFDGIASGGGKTGYFHQRRVSAPYLCRKQRRGTGGAG